MTSDASGKSPFLKQMRDCRECGQPFLSKSPFNRTCRSCQDKLETGKLQAVKRLHAKYRKTGNVE